MFVRKGSVGSVEVLWQTVVRMVSSAIRARRPMKNIAIIGGGPAGATAGEKLARQDILGAGRRVVIFEDRPAWEKPCGGGLPSRAIRRYPFLMEALDEHRCVQEVEIVAPN